jgi:Sigma-70 factor, region 1.1/Sigma-70 factor, region 1.2
VLCGVVRARELSTAALASSWFVSWWLSRPLADGGGHVGRRCRGQSGGRGSCGHAVTPGEERVVSWPVLQSADSGLAVAEREIERVQDAWFLGAGFWAGDGRHDARELQRLVVEGLEKGFLSFDEIATALEDVELTREQSEQIYTFLLECSIELVEGERRKDPPHEQPALAEDETKAAPKLDLSVEPSLDSLRLYLREIGKVPLLTGDQEVSLA